MDKLNQVDREKNVSAATLALAWCFHHPQVTMTLLGPRVPSQLDATRAAKQMDLSEEDLLRIGEIFGDL